MKFYSNGKLLLTGEYLVLDGAKALALPTKFGQYLEINSVKIISNTFNNNDLLWQSIDNNGKIWFQCAFKTTDFTIKQSKLLDEEKLKIAHKLQKILMESRNLNPFFLKDNESYFVKTVLDFPKDWGLGTSSTLINNIAQWAKIDAFTLQFKVFGGSGYDIACAQNDLPIIYQLENKKPLIKKVNFTPIFKENLFFIYLNTKRNSRMAIKAYQKNKKNIIQAIKKMDILTESLLNPSLILSDFENIIEEHEQIMASILGIETIKKQLFPDYFGSIKSLGAWEGDFILATGNNKTPQYFKEKGYATILPYQEMVK